MSQAAGVSVPQSDLSTMVPSETFYEYESSMQLLLLPGTLTQILKDYQPLYTDFILYSSGNRFVKSTGRVESKTVQERFNILRIILPEDEHREPFADTMFLPYTRTMSIETLIPFSLSHFTTYDSAIRRHIIYENVFINEKDSRMDYKIRVGLEERVSVNNKNNGHFFTAECEYSSEVFTYYMLLNIVETKFFELLFAQFRSILYNINYNFMFQRITDVQMCSIPSRKFHIVDSHTFSSKHGIFIKHKYDGFKARVVNIGDVTLYYDDLHNMFHVDPCGLFRKYVIYQLEIMEPTTSTNGETSANCIITDVIGVYINNVLYSPEPINVLQYFVFCKNQIQFINNQNALHLKQLQHKCDKYRRALENVDTRVSSDKDKAVEIRKLSSALTEKLNYYESNMKQLSDIMKTACDIFLHTLGHFRLVYQEPITVDDINNATPIDVTDGYIIVANNGEFKFKLPSIDVRYLSGFLHLDDEANSIIVPTQFPNLVHNAIYEITICNKHIVILKIRNDRSCAATMEEYKEFCHLHSLFENISASAEIL